MKKFRDFKSLSQEQGSILAQSKDDGLLLFYRLGMCTLGEQLKEGVYTSLGFNGGGYNPNIGWMTGAPGTGSIPDLEETSAFIVELDGQSLISKWEHVGTEKTEENDIMNVRVALKHRQVPCEVTVCTKYDGSGCLSRWLEIKNTADHAVTLTRLAPMSGMLEQTANWRKMLQNKENSPYRLGYFENTEHMHEGQFKWHSLHTDCYSFGGRYTRTRYRHPFFVLENKAKGTAYAAQLAYSGGYRFSFDFRPDPADGHLAFVAELDGIKPLRVLSAGETLVTPELVIAMVNGDMDDAIYAMHTHIRTAVMLPPHGPGCYTETAGGGTIENNKNGASEAAKKGFDIFYNDASWFYPQGGLWLAHVGNWDPDPDKFPNGVREMVEHCHKEGIKFGLWMEPERLGSLAKTAVSDADKLLRSQQGHIPGALPDKDKGGLYDLSREDVCAEIEGKICKMIEETGIDMFRLDFNVDYFAPWATNLREGYLESADLRYCQNFSAMFDRIRAKFPNVIFENCASGGGRTDLGTVKYFDHTWVTDNPIAPRCFAITNGMTMCLPPELVDRLVTSMDAPKMGSLEFDLLQLMFVRPTSHFPREKPENPLQVGQFERYMKLYNSFARPMLPTCKFFHHTPAFDDCEPKGVGILEAASEDGKKDMLGVFALSDPEKAEQTVRFKGVNASLRYRVTAVQAEETFEVSGYELKYKGINVMLRAALTAELFLAEAVE